MRSVVVVVGLVDEMISADAANSTAKSCGIAVMAKASAPGRTKTRLVPPLTSQEAAAFNTAFLQDISANILAAAHIRPIQPYMAYGPPGPDSVAFFRDALPPDIRLVEAWWPDFGSCLYGAIDRLLELGHASAVVLNSDSPTLPTSLLVETAEVLAQPGDRVVLGPSTDGGYYLLGLKSRHRRLFQDIAWSTDQVARQTLARAAELELRVHLLPAWYDVDDAQSLSVLYGELFEDRRFARGLHRHRAAFSARLMRTLLARSDLAARLDIVPRPAIAVAAG
jgi:rSAM/selenodomain-associated transferase 1